MSKSREDTIMSISPVAPSAPPTPPVPVQDKAQTQAAAPIPAPKPKDTVTLSKQAVQLASDGDTPAVEAKESAAEKATETLKGKK
jgi:hypothetical protein